MNQIEIPDGMKNLIDKNIQDESDKYRNAASDFATQGFDEVMISELLEINGCSREVSKTLASKSLSKIPEGYGDASPPVSYYDIIEIVKKTLVSTDIESVNEYFEKFGSKQTKDLPNRIMLARDNQIGVMFEELHKELEPIIDDLIVSNTVLAQNEDTQEPSEKEIMEQKLFGVWPPSLIRSHAGKEKAEEYLLKKTKPKDRDVPLFY